MLAFSIQKKNSSKHLFGIVSLMCLPLFHSVLLENSNAFSGKDKVKINKYIHMKNQLKIY